MTTKTFTGRSIGRLPERLTSAVLLMALAVSGCDDVASEAEAKNHTERPRAVRIETVESAVQRITHRFSGRIEAVQTVDLSFRVGGRLADLPVREGHVVKKGKLIARLDPADFQRAVREAEVNLTLARQDFARTEKLRQRSVVSEKSLDQARATRDLTEVALENARQNLSYTRLVAPFDALVTRRLVDNFTNVGAGTSVVRIQDVSEIQIDVDIPESLLATNTRKDIFDMAAEFQSVPGVRFPLEYREHSSEPNAVTQTYRVTLAMERPDILKVLPGMTASVFVTLDNPRPEGTRIPVSAVAADEKKAFFVWVYDEETGTVSKRPVEIGPLGKEVVQVMSGLQAGEKIITAGVHRLHEGMAVRPAKAF